MDFEYCWNLFVKAVGLGFYIVFQILQFLGFLAASASFARGFVLFVAWSTDGTILSAQYETLTLLGVLLFLRQNFLVSVLDDVVVRIISKCFGIGQPDLRFWEGVFEVQACICAQIILGPIIRETHLVEPSTFENGPISTRPLDPRREQVFLYIIFLGMLISISSGRTGCSGLCRSAGGETGCLCRRPANSLGYTSLGLRSIIMFLALLAPNIAIPVVYALLLNGFYSVGCVVGLDPVLIYYWLIFTAVLIGFGAAGVENRKPFPKPGIKPPFFAFVNHLKAQAYILHYVILPGLVFPLFNAKHETYLDAQNDNFRAFAILASLNMLLQIKLVVALLRLTLEIQKRRARLAGPQPEALELNHAQVRRARRGHPGQRPGRVIVPVPSDEQLIQHHHQWRAGIREIHLAHEGSSESDEAKDDVDEDADIENGSEAISQESQGHTEIFILASEDERPAHVPNNNNNNINADSTSEDTKSAENQEVDEDEVNNNMFSPI